MYGTSSTRSGLRLPSTQYWHCGESSLGQPSQGLSFDIGRTPFLYGVPFTKVLKSSATVVFTASTQAALTTLVACNKSFVHNSFPLLRNPRAQVHLRRNGPVGHLTMTTSSSRIAAFGITRHGGLSKEGKGTEVPLPFFWLCVYFFSARDGSMLPIILTICPPSPLNRSPMNAATSLASTVESQPPWTTDWAAIFAILRGLPSGR